LKRLGVQLLTLVVLFILMDFISGCAAGTVRDAPVPVITPSSAVLLAGQTLQFNATENGAPVANPVWLVSNVAGGSSATGTITSSGLYTAPTGSIPAAVQVNVNDLLHGTQSAPVPVSFFQPEHFAPGTVSASNNPQVALYNFTAPQGASVQVQFGTTTSYGLTTWSQAAPEGGGDVLILVAGMRASATYHLQAVVHLPTGNTVVDADQTFSTGALPADLLPNLTIQQTAGITPAAGVELLCLAEEASPTTLTAVITDLAGNVIWYYPIQPSLPFPMKLLPNGHMLIVVNSMPSEVREVDLAGNIIYRLPLAVIEQGLAAIGASFQTLVSLHHDILKLPNGHLILLASYDKTFTDEPGFTTVTGDALIDWDPQQNSAVWTWSTFDHIPLTHDPVSNTDWTHSNGLAYSPDDGNLILSMRNQNWIIKINYQDGVGDGTILWHLGPGGDFTLPAGQAPIEWNYGQHYPSLPGPNSAGIFPLMFFNNGNNRLVDANNDVCGTPGTVPCYSSVPTFQLDEYTGTAQVLREYNLSPAFSACCGNASQLSNEDVEYDVAADIYTPNVSFIQEITPEQPPQLVWQMNITGQLAYRGFRIPSLYPGVVWTQSAIATANANATVQRARKAVKQ
jgi:arylsulfate sulfotransferase